MDYIMLLGVEVASWFLVAEKVREYAVFNKQVILSIFADSHKNMT
jgi:hypothetical protein